MKISNHILLEQSRFSIFWNSDAFVLFTSAMIWIYHQPVELCRLNETCSLYQSCRLDPLSQVIYLLLDVMYSFPNKEGASVESFPTAFTIPIGLVKLVQGLWLLDHNDHQVHASFGYKAVAPGTI